MRRKIMVILLSTALCLAGLTPVLAGEKYWSGGWPTLSQYEKDTGKTIEKFNEAPVLEAMKELPSVEERLPEEPFVVDPLYEIGQYGGDLHQVVPRNLPGWLRTNEDYLVMYAPDPSKGYYPNFVTGWEISEGGKTYTFHLRKGVKWSDGVPVTADDFVFFYEDVLMNEELNAWNPWSTLEMKKIDDWTVQYSFPEANGLFLPKQAWQEGWESTLYLLFAPKHYLEQFHPNYVSQEELDKLVEEAGFERWAELFTYKYDWLDKDRPTIRAWKIASERDAMHIVWQRNPYYWKVDPEGNQLPYIDRLVYDIVGNEQMVTMKATAGEIDFQQTFLGRGDYPLLVENEERGDYTTYAYNSSLGVAETLVFNLTCKDPVLQEIFAKDKFRKALSLAINREEVNELVYNGMGIPRQASIPKGAAYYDPEWENLYAEYDPERANAMLDKIGLDQRDAEGWRLRPDGERLELVYLMAELGAGYTHALELVKAYWDEVGCKTTINPVARTLFFERRLANEWELSGFDGMGYLYPTFLLNPITIMPVTNSADVGGNEFGKWYESKGESGIEPTGDLARLQELWDKIKVTADKEKRDELAREAVELHKKNLWIIGCVQTPSPVIVKNGLGNVPEEFVTDWQPKGILPCQFFWKK